MKIDVEAAIKEVGAGIDDREELLIRREPGESIFRRNRQAIWRLVVIATLTIGVCVILLPIVTCL